MKLLVVCVPYDSGKSGISKYIDNVVVELADAGHDLTLLIEHNAAEFFRPYRTLVMPDSCNAPLFSMAYCLFRLPFLIASGEYDRVIVMAGNRRMPLYSSKELYAIVHDMSQFHVSGKYDPFRMLYVTAILPFLLRWTADHLCAVSASTARDLVQFCKIPAGKISVSYNGVNTAPLPCGQNDAADRVVLYVSRIEVPGKNHANLIRAWEMLPADLLSQYKLVIAGADWSGAGEIHAQAKRSPVSSTIEFTGFISDSELHELYRHASAYVFPSFFEGFGLSLIEAMACGLVCCCSNNSSLGEIADDAALTFDPASPEQIADCIRRLLTDSALRQNLRRKGIERAACFSWKTHAASLTAPRNSDYAEIFGVRFSTQSMQAALTQMDAMVHSTEKSFFCAFINADCLNQAYVNESYRALLPMADLVWADGIGAALAARSLHTPVQDNVNGTDMLPYLCQRGYSLFLLGGKPGVAEQAAVSLRKQYPETRILGTQHGYFNSAELPQVIQTIHDAAPEILLVAMGCPRQEEWIHEHLSQLNCKIALGVGGLLDFASGRIPRAPLWMRKLRMEWMFRLWQEPTRLFRRYIIGNPLFLMRVCYESIRHRHASSQQVSFLSEH